MAIRRTEFESGLRIVTEKMPGVRSVTLGIWVSAGSRDEQPRIAGSSHFLEHLLFKGTPSRTAQDIAEEFDAVGGDLNAWTAKENTCFYARVLDRDLPMAVDHMCDMLQNSVLRPADFDSERQVILEEINMHEDTPDDLIHDVMNEALWPDHPLGRPVLGTTESITNVSRDQVKRFYKSHYTPHNFVVCVAGNVDHDELIKLVRRGMDTGRAKRGKAAATPKAKNRDIPKPVPARLVKHRPTEQAHICLGTNGLSRADDDRFAFGALNAALGGGMSSRLFQEIREKRGLAYSVYSYHQMFAETGLFTVYAGTTPSKAHEVLELLRKELDDVAAKGITAAELDRAKGHMKGSLVLALEDSGGRMSRLGKAEIARAEILSINQSLKRVDAITLEDTQRAAERVLRQTMALAVIGPFEQGAFGDDDGGEAAA
jgi:predicted Zn-dependent peptidase